MLYIFDKDGTLVEPIAVGMSSRPPNTPAEQLLMPNVKEKLQALKKEGHKLSVASNQGGVAWGYMNLEEAAWLFIDLQHKLELTFDYWLYCPYDPNAAGVGRGPREFQQANPNRKPQPGMLLELMLTLRERPENTVMVGDNDEDRIAAKEAGCQFVLARDFFAQR